MAKQTPNDSNNLEIHRPRSGKRGRIEMNKLERSENADFDHHSIEDSVEELVSSKARRKHWHSSEMGQNPSLKSIEIPSEEREAVKEEVLVVAPASFQEQEEEEESEFDSAKMVALFLGVASLILLFAMVSFFDPKGEPQEIVLTPSDTKYTQEEREVEVEEEEIPSDLVEKATESRQATNAPRPRARAREVASTARRPAPPKSSASEREARVEAPQKAKETSTPKATQVAKPAPPKPVKLASPKSSQSDSIREASRKRRERLKKASHIAEEGSKLPSTPAKTKPAIKPQTPAVQEVAKKPVIPEASDRLPGYEIDVSGF